MENTAYAASIKLTDAKCSDIFKNNSFPRKAPKFDTQKTLPNGPGISLQTHEKGSVTFHVVQREYIILTGMKLYIIPVYTIFDLTVFQSNHGGFLFTMVAFIFVFIVLCVCCLVVLRFFYLPM